MTDHVHLDLLVSATSHRLHLQLLETFRDVSRDPNTASSDYPTRLKTIMEDALGQEAANAPGKSHDQ
jgi:hypothetical protein